MSVSGKVYKLKSFLPSFQNTVHCGIIVIFIVVVVVIVIIVIVVICRMSPLSPSSAITIIIITIIIIIMNILALGRPLPSTLSRPLYSQPFSFSFKSFSIFLPFTLPSSRFYSSYPLYPPCIIRKIRREIR